MSAPITTQTPLTPINLDSVQTRIQPINPVAAAQFHTLRQRVAQSGPGELDSTELHSVIDPQALEEQATSYYELESRPTWLGKVELVRNVLVLVPIMLTWFELWHAAGAYNQLLLQRGEDLLREPFLLLWERDFYGVGGPLVITFGHLALIDFLLLLIVVVLTYLVHRHRDILDEAAVRRAAELRQNVELALWQLEQQLPSRAPLLTQPEVLSRVGDNIRQFNLSAGKLIDELQLERQFLADEVNQRGKAINELELFSERLTLGADLLLQYGRQVDTTHTRLHEAISHMLEEVEMMGQQQQYLTAAINQLGGHSAQLADTQLHLSRTFDSAVEGLRETSNSHADNMQVIRGAADEMRQLAATLLSEETTLRQALLEVRDYLQASTTHIGDVTAGMGTLVGSLRQLIDEVTRDQQSHRALTREVVHNGQQQGQLVAEATEQLANLASMLAGGEQAFVEAVAALQQSMEQVAIVTLDAATQQRETARAHAEVGAGLTTTRAEIGELVQAILQFALEQRQAYQAVVATRNDIEEHVRTLAGFAGQQQGVSHESSRLLGAIEQATHELREDVGGLSDGVQELRQAITIWIRQGAVLQERMESTVAVVIETTTEAARQVTLQAARTGPPQEAEDVRDGSVRLNWLALGLTIVGATFAGGIFTALANQLVVRLLQ